MAFRTLKPGTLLAPVPAVLLTSGAERDGMVCRNVMTAAWAGTVCTRPPMVSVSVRPERYSYGLIRESGEFVVCLTTRALLTATDLCGVISGRDGDKWQRAGLTPVPAEGMRYAPAVGESPVYLACRLEQSIPLGSHTMLIGRTVSMGVEEGLMDAKGALHLERADLIAYSHGVYTGLTEALGFFGFSVASEEAKKRRGMRAPQDAGRRK